MAITTVRAQINGQWYSLTYDGGSGAYTATLTAPGATSQNQPGGYYNVRVEATNDAGTTGTADGSTLAGLKLVVLEKVPPVITILTPSNGAYVTNNRQPVTFTVVDEAGGSGVDLETLIIKQNGTPVSASEYTSSAITNGYSITYTPAAALPDGQNTVTINVSDKDGNAAAEKSTTYTVDTVPPTLNITAPSEGFVTNTASLTIIGTTNDTTSSPVEVKIQLNGTDQGAVTIQPNGSFTKAVTLREGENTIVITATDAAGKTSSVTRVVKLDTSVPQVTNATITPNPVDAGQTMIISVTITEG